VLQPSILKRPKLQSKQGAPFGFQVVIDVEPNIALSNHSRVVVVVHLIPRKTGFCAWCPLPMTSSKITIPSIGDICKDSTPKGSTKAGW